MLEYFKSNIHNFEIVAAVLISWLFFSGKNTLAKIIRWAIIIVGILCIVQYLRLVPDLLKFLHA